MAKIKLPNLEVSKETRKESEMRLLLYTSNHVTDKFKPTYLHLKITTIDPYIAFLVKTEEIYKMINGPLVSIPTKNKNALGCEVQQNIIDMRKHMIRSAIIDSRSIPEAIECSSALTELMANLDLMCGLDYISTNNYSNLCKETFILDKLLRVWFEVLKHYKLVNSSKIMEQQ